MSEDDWGRKELLGSLLESAVQPVSVVVDSTSPTAVRKSTFAGFAQEGEKWFLVTGSVETKIEACDKPKGT